MTNSETSSKKLLPAIPNWPPAAMLALASLGFTDASYLAAKYYLGSPVACSIIEGCEKVLSSPYATWWDVPVSLFGAAYYLTILFLIIGYVDTKRASILRLAAWLTTIGFLFSLWFVYLQLFIIKAICLYCAASAITSILLFVLGTYILKMTSSAAKAAV